MFAPKEKARPKKVATAPVSTKTGAKNRHQFDSPGARLDPAVRGSFESKFGFDFSQVRIHTGGPAAASAADMHASAYTFGDDIVFGAGNYAPHDLGGQWLLAHELSHVVQQAGTAPTRVSVPPSHGVGDPAAEREANRAAFSAMAGQRVNVGEARPPQIARQGLDDQDDVRRALGLAGPTQNATPKTVWLGKQPAWIASDPTAPTVFLGNTSSSQKAMVNGARSAPQQKGAGGMELLPPPRTAFEADAFRRNLKRIRDPKTNVIIGFFETRSGVYWVYNINGKGTTVGEKPLESPLVDPIDLIPFELLGSLAKDAAVFTGKTVLKAAGKTAVKEAGVEAAEIGTRALVEGAAEQGIKTATQHGGEAAAELSIKTADETAVASAGKHAGPLHGATDAEIEGALGQGFKPEGDLQKLQPHRGATANREALEVSGAEVQSAHGAPQSVMGQVPGYNPKDALTKLMSRAEHTAMDQHWKDSFIAMQKAGVKKATAQRVYDIVAESIRRTPSMAQGTKKSLIARLSDEMFVEYGLKPGDMLELPYRNFAPK